MSVLRDLFNKIAPSWKAGAPNVTKWMDEATTEIDALNAYEAKAKQAVAGVSLAEPYTLDQVSAAVRKILAGLQ